MISWVVLPGHRLGMVDEAHSVLPTLRNSMTVQHHLSLNDSIAGSQGVCRKPVGWLVQIIDSRSLRQIRRAGLGRFCDRLHLTF